MKKLITLLLALSATYIASACSAHFTTSISGGAVTFTNTSVAPTHTGSMAVYANWTFGDGGYSSSYNTSHTYATSGKYAVTLCMNWYDSASFSYVCGDTLYDSVTVTSGGTPTGLSGSIIRDSSLGTVTLDSIYVWLITVDTTTHIISAVDSELVAAYSGSVAYSFTGVTPGDYLVKAAGMFGSSGSGFIPTYHYSELHWNTAGYVTVTSGSMTTGTDIYMQWGTLTSGPGFIAGDVRYGAGKTTYTVGDPDPGVTIYLMNATTGKLVSSTVTDATGAYSFPHVPVGSYTISPERAGKYGTATGTITVSATSHYTAINFSENSKSIKPSTTAVPTVAKATNIALYPNPAHDQVTIEWNGIKENTANITITNITGQNVLNTTVSTNAASKLSLSALQPGLYFININAGDTNYKQKLVIE